MPRICRQIFALNDFRVTLSMFIISLASMMVCGYTAHFLCLEVELTQFGMQFTLNGCKILTQDWQESVPGLYINYQQLYVACYSAALIRIVIIGMGQHLPTCKIFGRGFMLDCQ